MFLFHFLLLNVWFLLLLFYGLETYFFPLRSIRETNIRRVNLIWRTSVFRAEIQLSTHVLTFYKRRMRKTNVWSNAKYFSLLYVFQQAAHAWYIHRNDLLMMRLYMIYKLLQLVCTKSTREIDALHSGLRSEPFISSQNWIKPYLYGLFSWISLIL